MGIGQYKPLIYPMDVSNIHQLSWWNTTLLLVLIIFIGGLFGYLGNKMGRK